MQVDFQNKMCYNWQSKGVVDAFGRGFANNSGELSHGITLIDKTYLFAPLADRS